MSDLQRRLLWLTTYAVTMAYLESAVVVYLRALYYPQGFDFPLVTMSGSMVAVEIGREAATVLMLLAVAMLTGRDAWERFFAFSIAFGVWDIFYYVWLWVFLRWPPSLLTWDVLFLIPVPWLGPVLAPVIVSIALVAGSLWLWRLKMHGHQLAFSKGLWTLAIAGGCLVLVAFTIDFQSAVQLQLPSPFHWEIFLAGVALAVFALMRGAVGPSAGARS